MKAEKLINWGELSRILAGSRSVITKKRIGKKHEAAVSALISLIENWSKEFKLNDNE